MAGLTATFSSSTQFTVSGDYTTLFTVGRIVKCNCGVDGYKYATVSSSSYSNPNTTVNLIAKSDDLTNNLTEVWAGIQGSGATGSVPDHNHDLNTQGSGGATYAVWG